MVGKILICRCEDVLLHEIESAIHSGHLDIESIKRYTGFGTGVCQGKSCLPAVARLLAMKTVVTAPFTPRPPLQPIALRLLAGDEDV